MQMIVLTMFAVMTLHPEYLTESPKIQSGVSSTVKVYMNSFDNTDDSMNVNWFQNKQWSSGGYP